MSLATRHLGCPAPNVIVGGPDVLGGQHPDYGQLEVVVFGFPGGWSGAQGVPLPAHGALVQLVHELTAKAMQRLGAATAKLMAEPPRFEAYDAPFLRSARMGGFARGHPEDSAYSGQGPAGLGARLPLARVLHRVVCCGVVRLLMVPVWCVNLSAGPICSVSSGCSRFVGRPGRAALPVCIAGYNVAAVRPHA